MNNQNTTYALNKAVREEVFEAMCGATYWAVSGAVDNVWFRAVHGIVYWAGYEDPPHPALRDFLGETKETL